MSKKKQEKENAKIIQELLSRPENQYCADCGAKGPRWASVNIGCFLCIRCAGLHRSLGSDISKIKSTMLDTWSVDNIKLMDSMGNEKVNQKYLCKGNAPSPNVNSDSDMERYIREKYEKCSFCYEKAKKGFQERIQHLVGETSSKSSSSYDAEAKQLEQMGFTDYVMVQKALKHSRGDFQGALDYLISRQNVETEPARREPQSTKREPQTIQERLRSMGHTDEEAIENALVIAGGDFESAKNLLNEWKQTNLNSQLPKQKQPAETRNTNNQQDFLLDFSEMEPVNHPNQARQVYENPPMQNPGQLAFQNHAQGANQFPTFGVQFQNPQTQSLNNGFSNIQKPQFPAQNNSSNPFQSQPVNAHQFTQQNNAFQQFDQPFQMQQRSNAQPQNQSSKTAFDQAVFQAQPSNDQPFGNSFNNAFQQIDQRFTQPQPLKATSQFNNTFQQQPDQAFFAKQQPLPSANSAPFQPLIPSNSQNIPNAAPFQQQSRQAQETPMQFQQQSRQGQDNPMPFQQRQGQEKTAQIDAIKTLMNQQQPQGYQNPFNQNMMQGQFNTPQFNQQPFMNDFQNQSQFQVHSQQQGMQFAPRSYQQQEQDMRGDIFKQTYQPPVKSRNDNLFADLDVFRK